MYKLKDNERSASTQKQHVKRFLNWNRHMNIWRGYVNFFNLNPSLLNPIIEIPKCTLKNLERGEKHFETGSL